MSRRRRNDKPSNGVDHDIKLLLVGDSGVGKSCLLLRFSDGSFTESFITTIGIDFKIKTMDVDGKRVKMQIWDTAGQERFRTITKAYYRGAMGVMLVYDVTKRDSYDSVSAWMSKICRHATDGTQKLLMGNKCDMEAERVVTLEEGEELATKFDVPFFETSAKEDINVNEAFVELARLIMRHYPQVGEPARTRKLSESVPASKPSSQSSCC